MILRDKTFLGDAASFAHCQRGERGVRLGELAGAALAKGIKTCGSNRAFCDSECDPHAHSYIYLLRDIGHQQKV